MPRTVIHRPSNLFQPQQKRVETGRPVVQSGDICPVALDALLVELPGTAPGSERIPFVVIGFAARATYLKTPWGTNAKSRPVSRAAVSSPEASVESSLVLRTKTKQSVFG